MHVSAAAFIYNKGFSDNIDVIPNQFIYYLGTVSVPLFFMANGFFLINRKVMNYKYIFRKIILILIPVFFWNLLYTFYGLIFKGSFQNVFLVSLKSLLQEGYFFQFWFMGSLIVLLILVPFFNYLIKNYKKTYFFILFVLLFVSLIFDLCNHFSGQEPIQVSIIQTFRLWTWGAYYMLGGIIGDEKTSVRIKAWFQKVKGNIVTIVLSVLLPFYAIINKQIFGNPYAEFNYDNVIVMLWIFFIFIFLLRWEPKKKIATWVSFFSSASMGVYILHTLVIKVVTHFINPVHPLSNFLVILVVIIFSFGIVLAMKRIPVIRRLVTL